MSDKKKSKRRKDEYTGPGGAENEIQKATKQEFKIAKWIKNNVPTKKTKFLNHNVSYFTATKALDALMASKFAQGDDCLFPTRAIAIDFMDTMLIHKFFHRAKKVPVSESELRRGKKNIDKEKEDDNNSSAGKGGGGGDVRKRKVTKDDGKAQESVDSSKDNKDKDKDKDNKEKKKRKIRLDMHPDQVFIDGSEAYVWIYDPIPIHYWIMGTFFVIGAILICLFPLWPPSLRKGVYYLSLVAAGLLVFILGLAVVRFIVFCIVWAVTGSKHHFWLFPNLTEDVGFFASFWPIYSHETQEGLKAKADDKNKKRKKDKESDVEEEDMTITYLDTEKIENIKEHDAEIPLNHFRYNQNVTEGIGEKLQSKELKEGVSEISAQSSESEPEGIAQRSENSKSSSRTSCENFEIIDINDFSTATTTTTTTATT